MTQKRNLEPGGIFKSRNSVTQFTLVALVGGDWSYQWGEGFGVVQWISEDKLHSSIVSGYDYIPPVEVGSLIDLYYSKNEKKT